MKITKILIALLFTLNIFAGEFDDEFSGNDIIQVKQTKTKKINAVITIKGYSSYNYTHKKTAMHKNNFTGFSSSKISIDTDINYKIKDIKLKANIKKYKDFIYAIKKDDYLVVPKDYDEYTDINKLYIQGSIKDNLDFKIGRQIITWGKSDYLSIVDILSPTDKRALGLMDVKDIKLGKTMAKIDYYYNNFTFNTIAILENRYSILPSFGSDFAPPKPSTAQIKQLKATPPKLVSKIENNIDNIGLAFSILGEFDGQDIGIYLANLYLDGQKNRSSMIGLAYNKAINSFLIKSEMAYFENKDTLDVLVGLDYTIRDGIMGLELSYKNEDIFYASRISKKYINQTLDLSLMYIGSGKDIGKNGIVKAIADYAINDKIAINVGIVEYFGEKGNMFGFISENDRVFLNLKYIK